MEASYLAIVPWDIERWESSGAYLRMGLAAQGAYRNLCDKAWKAQPTCVLPLDDRALWKLAGAPSPQAWLEVKAEVLASDAWAILMAGDYPVSLLNEVVLETYLESAAKHQKAVRSGRTAGKASARARRAMSQAAQSKQHRTAVQRSFNDRSTIVNPPSPSPSPSPSTDSLSISLSTGPPTPGPETVDAHANAVLDGLVARQAQLSGRSPGRGTADALQRLLVAGRTPDEIARVLEAYHGMSTESAVFARRGSPGHLGGPGLLWALRPGEPGGFDRILGQLDEAELVRALEETPPANGNGHHPTADPPESHTAAGLAWVVLLERLEAKLARQTFATWFRPSAGWSLEGGVLTVVHPSADGAAWLRDNYGDVVLEVAAGTEVSEVRFIAHEGGA